MELVLCNVWKSPIILKYLYTNLEILVGSLLQPRINLFPSVLTYIIINDQKAAKITLV